MDRLRSFFVVISSTYPKKPIIPKKPMNPKYAALFNHLFR